MFEISNTSKMNSPDVPDAKLNNTRLFPPYAKKLQSNDFQTYSVFAQRFANWLTDGRAYYKEARPEIAQATLRRNTGADMDGNVSFHISTYIKHPMVVPYAKLLKAVHPHKDRFVEPDLYVHEANSVTQQVFLPFHSAGSSISTFSTHSTSPPTFPNTQTIPTSNNALYPVEYPSTSTIPNLGSQNLRPLPLDNPLPPHNLGLNDGQNISPSSQNSILPPQEPVTLKPKKKKKKPAFELESLIELDLQELQKRADPTVKEEASDIPIPFPGPHPEVIVIDDDEPEPVEHMLPCAAGSTLSSSENETPTLVDKSLREAPSSSAMSSESHSIDLNPVAQELADIVMADGTTQEQEITTMEPTSMSGVEVAVKSLTDTGPDSTTRMASDGMAREEPALMSGVEVAVRSSTDLGLNPTTRMADISTESLNPIPAPSEAMEVEKHQSSAEGEPLQQPASVSSRPPLTAMRTLDRPLVQTTDNQTSVSGLAVAPAMASSSSLPSAVNAVSLPPVMQNPSPPVSLAVNINPFLSSPHSPSTLAESTSSAPVVVKVCTAEELRALHSFGPEMRILRVQNGESRETPSFVFDISGEDFETIRRWNNRKNTVDHGTKSIDELSDLPITWPQGDTLRMDVMYKGHQRAILPLSPPFLMGSNGLVDVSEHMCLGENVIGLKQSGDMTPYVFVLRMHRPTGAQLEELERRRQKDRDWNNFQLRMARPFEVTIPPRNPKLMSA
ncbi:hypothetical protein H0H92_012306 [Tricholoma furcatifolium]|nr:hypothetical protein H0H92_012306 [Tricholoma furcatifolium]